jgi:hypothetical protein
MEYTAQLLNPRALLVPLIALVVGAGGAIGVYAVLDDTDVNVQPTRVVVADPPAQPGPGVAAKHESATAAAIATPAPTSSFEGKDEAASAAAISTPGPTSSFKGKDEAATASAIGTGSQTVTSSPRTWLESKDEAGTASAIGNGSQTGTDQESANRTDPHGPAAALP